MGFLRFVVWTTVCVALGIFLGTYQLGAHTPWQLMQSTWKEQSPRLDKVKGEAEGLVDDVKKKVSTQDPVAQPKERHTADEREAVDQIISKRSKG